MKRFAEGQEPPVLVPPVVPEVQVQLPIRGVAIQVSHVAVLIRIQPRNAQRTI